MKVIILGNAGAGKTTLARTLMASQPAALLSLEVAFKDGTERRPLQDSIAEVMRWLAGQQSWIIEGCHAGIIEPLLGHCDELIFLNPGVEACIAHCLSRPWEPEKFASPSCQRQERCGLQDDRPTIPGSAPWIAAGRGSWWAAVRGAPSPPAACSSARGRKGRPSTSCSRVRWKPSTPPNG
jgi:hypothetical protein